MKLLLFILILVCFVLIFFETVSLLSTDCPETHYVDRAGCRQTQPLALPKKMLIQVRDSDSGEIH